MAHILVVDDEEWILELIEMALMENEYEVTTASNGAEAFKIFQTTNFDLIVTDILMPEEDGVFFVLQVFNSGRETPVIAISGGGGGVGFVKSALERIQKIPIVCRIIKKPFCPFELCEIINDVIK